MPKTKWSAEDIIALINDKMNNEQIMTDFKIPTTSKPAFSQRIDRIRGKIEREKKNPERQFDLVVYDTISWMDKFYRVTKIHSDFFETKQVGASGDDINERSYETKTFAKTDYTEAGSGIKKRNLPPVNCYKIGEEPPLQKEPQERTASEIGKSVKKFASCAENKKPIKQITEFEEKAKKNFDADMTKISVLVDLICDCLNSRKLVEVSTVENYNQIIKKYTD